MSTTAHQRYLYWARSVQSTPFRHMPSIYIVILSFHPRLGLPNGLFSPGFLTKPLYTIPFFFTMHAKCPPPPRSHSHWLSYMIPTLTNMERNTDYEHPHRAVFSNTFLKNLPPLTVISSSAHSSPEASTCGLPLLSEPKLYKATKL